uniref:Uncharacterized protein n=1 Tax=Cherry rusty mottle associated virus TaxID=1312929 RepID=A0A0U2DCV3_9VIRU|nr:hypothetical protein [Cherry rusty mottle associated virus]
MRKIWMEPSSLIINRERSQRRRRLGRTLKPQEMKESKQRRAILRSSEPEEEGSLLTPKIPPQVLAKILSETFKKRTQLHSISHLTTSLRPLLLTGLNTSRCLKLRRLIASLMLSGTVIITAPATKQSLLGGPNAELSLKILQVLLGATALYAVSALNMLQSSGISP